MEIFKLKLTIQDSNPLIWRRVEVPCNFSMALLHDLIQIAMGWSNSHLHEFIAKKVRYGDDEDSENNYEGVVVGDLLSRKGSKMLYVYDFGDNWEVEIVLENVDKKGSDDAILPICTDGEGDFPLEDIGGICGYMDLCQALNEKKKGVASDLTEWLDDIGMSDYKPIPFNMTAINKKLSKAKFKIVKAAKKKKGLDTSNIIDELFQTLDDDIGKKTSKKLWTDREKSDILLLKACDCAHEEAVALVDEALKLCPDNYNAHFLKGNNSLTPEEALVSYRKGLDLAETQFGEKYFEENKGHFWELFETRVYMMMKESYAKCLYVTGDDKSSISQLKELLELNPGDNQGIRYFLSSQLLENKCYADFKKLYEDYEKEESTCFSFNYALYCFAKTGGSASANKALKAAAKTNPYVIPILKNMEKEFEYNDGGIGYTLGGRDDANYYITFSFEAWMAIPNALSWLKSVKL